MLAVFVDRGGDDGCCVFAPPPLNDVRIIGVLIRSEQATPSVLVCKGRIFSINVLGTKEF